MTKRQLDKILKDHKLWLIDKTKGKRANLSGTDLSGAYLYKADLSGINLSRTNLFNANLYGANLNRVNLFESNLSGVNLSGTDLTGTIVKGFYLGKDFGYMWKNDKDKIIIKIGCEEHESKEFIKKAKEIGAKHGYTDKDIKLYTKVVKLLIKEM